MNLNDFDPFFHSSLLFYQYLSALGGAFVSYEDNQLWALRSGVENPWFNFLLFKDRSSPPFEKAMEFFSSLPFECTFKSTRSDLIEKCENYGLVFGEKTMGMALKMNNFNEKPLLNKDINIQIVQNETHIRWWINLTSLGFRLPKINVKNFFYPIYGAGSDKFNFSLCFLKGVPAAASLIFIDPPYSSILSLVSLAKFGNKDLAFALLQEQLSLAKMKGVLDCTVHADSFGISALESPAYERLGFQKKQESLTYLFLPNP